MSAIAILDAGGQYCHLIARRIRELGVHTEVLPIEVTPEQLEHFDGVVISGGPRSVLEDTAPRIDPNVLALGIPVLGICYGHQLMAHTLDRASVVSRPGSKEYGPAGLTLQVTDTIFKGLPRKFQVWMSHGDAVQGVPQGFRVMASTEDCSVAAMGDLKRNLFGLQFHPEVVHTKYGDDILRNFVHNVCRCESSWEPAKPPAVGRLLDSIRERVKPDQRVLFFVSGGVDSSVAYRLCVEALGPERLHGVFVDNGLLRSGEVDDVRSMFQQSGFENIEVIRADEHFLRAIGDAVDPEEKRRRIGAAFLEVENRVLQQFPRGEWLLGQGTIYPDTIESGGSRESALIKTHHNRVPELILRVANGEILEPLVDFYKDEVRRIGLTLGLPPALIQKQPFPGPGLAVRCLCSNRNLLPNAGSTDLVAGIAAEFGFRGSALPIRAVGVQGDERTYAAVAVIEGVTGKCDWDSVRQVSRVITNTVPNINRVAYVVRAKTDVREWVGHVAYLNKRRLDNLRWADAIARSVIENDPSSMDIWQCPVIQLPVGKRGVGSEVIVLRPVQSVDGMTAEFVALQELTLTTVGNRLLDGDERFEALLCDVTNKPPATIEWE